MENSPMNFYLSSLEEQVRCELLDREARITQATTKDRVLLEIDEDCLQHFLDVLHEKNETSKSTEMEISKNLCQATVDKQLDVISQLKEALHEAQQELKNGHRQWQEEKSSLNARQQKNCDHFHSQVQVIASIRAEEQEAVTQTLEKAQAFHQTQLEEQRTETNRIAAALKDTQDLLDTERLQHKTTTKAELEIFENLCQARIVELVDENSKLKAAFFKAQNELKNRDLLWQQEKSSYLDRNKKAWGLYHTLVKTTADSGRKEEEAKQTLQRFQADHKGQLEEQRTENNRIAAALKDTQDLLDTERLQHKTTTKAELEIFENLCQARIVELVDENSKLKAAFFKAQNELKNRDLLWQQEKSSYLDRNKKAWGLYHTLVKTTADSGRKEEEAKQTLQRFQADHKGQLEEQRTENNRIAAALKDTQDLLDTERLQHKTTTKAELEIFENLCLAMSEINRIKAAQKRQTEDLLGAECSLRQHEKCIHQATEEDLQNRITNMQKKKKKWFKLF